MLKKHHTSRETSRSNAGQTVSLSEEAAGSCASKNNHLQEEEQEERTTMLSPTQSTK